MNAPLNPNPKPVSVVLLEDIIADLKPAEHIDYSKLISPRLTPLEADIAREDEAARLARTADPVGVYMTLLETQHTLKEVGQEEFVKWLSDREWPEEQSQVYRGAELRLMKLFKGPDGFAVKWVPIEDGCRLNPGGTIIEIYTLVKP